MLGSLNDILAEPISQENERILEEFIKDKAKVAVGVSVQLLGAMEKRFGTAAREVVSEMAQDHPCVDDMRAEPGGPDEANPAADLRKFCQELDGAVAGSHRGERVVDEPDRVAYEFTRCMWAELYREAGEPELGRMICDGDEPALKACNPKLGLKLTEMLMNGDKICNHVFYVEK